MSENLYKPVDFDKHCPTCKYSGLSEYEQPCVECMDNFSNYASYRPVKWEKGKDFSKQDKL